MISTRTRSRITKTETLKRTLECVEELQQQQQEERKTKIQKSNSSLDIAHSVVSDIDTKEKVDGDDGWTTLTYGYMKTQLPESLMDVLIHDNVQCVIHGPLFVRQPELDDVVDNDDDGDSFIRIPELHLTSPQCDRDYLDSIRPQDLTHPVMTGLSHGRRFFAFKLLFSPTVVQKQTKSMSGGTFVCVVFQRYTPNGSWDDRNCWVFGDHEETFRSIANGHATRCGHLLYHCTTPDKEERFGINETSVVVRDWRFLKAIVSYQFPCITLNVD